MRNAKCKIVWPLAALICALASVDAEEPRPGEAHQESATPGPLVDVSFKDARQWSHCLLLSFDEGILTLRKADGETAKAKAEEIKSIRLQAPPAPPLAKASEQTEANDPRNTPLNPEEFARLRKYRQKPPSTLTKAEEEDFRKLRERPLPPFAEAMRKRDQSIEAEMAWLDEGIRIERDKVKTATSDAEARTALAALIPMYRRRYGPLQLSDLLKQDAQSINDAEVRRRALEGLQRLIEAFRPLKRGVETKKPSE